MLLYLNTYQNAILYSHLVYIRQQIVDKVVVEAGLQHIVIGYINGLQFVSQSLLDPVILGSF